MSGIQQGLLISYGANALAFVGGVGSSLTASTAPSYSLTSLTGGTNSAPSAGDLVVAAIQINDTTNRDITCTTSGYTEVADLYANNSGGDDCQLAVYYKVLTAADTSVAFSFGGASLASRFVVHVWRKPNLTPLDATTTTATTTTYTSLDAPSITTATNNAVVIAIGAVADGDSSLTGISVPSGMSNFFSAGAAANRLGIASIARATAGAYDPPAFGITGSPGGDASTCSATMALKPQ
jgi:hypothetical protein